MATEYTVPMLGWWRHDGPSLGEATRNSHELAMTDGTPSVLAAGLQPAIRGSLRTVLDQPIAPQSMDEEITSLVRPGWMAWEDTRGSPLCDSPSEGSSTDARCVHAEG